MKKTIWIGIALICLMFCQTAYSAKFANQFVEFELPPNWQCGLEGAEWVCQSADKNKKKDAIIVLAAKLKGEQDSLEKYQVYLTQNKSYESADGKPVKSESKYAKAVKINDHSWVDSLHLESELRGFYTRYLATVKKDIGVLVTYSINKDKYNEYLKQFEGMVNTLRVFRKSGFINAGSPESDIFKNTNIPKHVSPGSVFPVMPIDGDGGEGEGGDKKGDDFTLYLMIAAGVVLFILWRKKKG
jgi:hypothetical protein